jgi:alpha-mannosidase
MPWSVSRSHAATKKGNRKLEIFLREVEYFATLASTTNGGKSKYAYPKKELDASWEKLLLCQVRQLASFSLSSFLVHLSSLALRTI